MPFGNAHCAHAVYLYPHIYSYAKCNRTELLTDGTMYI